MAERNDHDILIALETKLDLMYAGQQQFQSQWTALVERVTSLEIERSRQATSIENMEEELDDLRKKTNLVDVINAIAAAAAGIVGFFFGQH